MGDDNAINWVQIHYHVWWPAPGNDPFYLYNTSLAQTRNNYYNNNYTPHMFTGGNDSGSSPATWRSHALNMIGQYTPVTIILNGGIEGYDLALSVTVSSETDLSAAPTRLFVVATIDSVYYVGSNGLAWHEHTIVDLLTSYSGDPITLNGIDDVVLNYSWTMDSGWPNNNQVTWNINNLNLVVFVQNYSTKEVYQAETSRANQMDNDSDDDGVANSEDNCPDVYNPNQEDVDSDEIGDACDPCDNLNVFIIGNLNGDVDNDTPIIDLFDILHLVDLILTNDFSGCSGEAAEINGDNIINVLDIIQLVQNILEPGNRLSSSGNAGQATLTVIEDDNTSRLVLNSSKLIAGIQFRISSGTGATTVMTNHHLPEGWVLASEMIGNEINVLCYDFSGRNPRKSIVVEFPGRFQDDITDVVVGDMNGNLVEIILDRKSRPLAVELPARVVLKDLFPNPFNPVVSVPFSIPYEMHTTIIVYNLRGEVVDILLDKPHLRSGNHNISWDATYFSSGMYFIQVQTPLGRETQKAFLVK